jgi:hypothetical protein
MTPAPKNKSTGAWIIAGLVLVLLILHQDNWYWHDDTLIFGFMPIGLFWHACLSVAASLTWALATVIAWPVDDDASLRDAVQPPPSGLKSDDTATTEREAE